MVGLWCKAESLKLCAILIPSADTVYVRFFPIVINATKRNLTVKTICIILACFGLFGQTQVAAAQSEICGKIDKIENKTYFNQLQVRSYDTISFRSGEVIDKLVDPALVSMAKAAFLADAEFCVRGLKTKQWADLKICRSSSIEVERTNPCEYSIKR